MPQPGNVGTKALRGHLSETSATPMLTGSALHRTRTAPAFGWGEACSGGAQRRGLRA
uniref:Uncharacterized protein n=1 Tax=Ralstonia solanacearum CFBP2957 TaxID=859656 RepID=D8P5C5_RALSL|nr:protein of unknown function [Ralstonia solanacearum CFBP2957]